MTRRLRKAIPYDTKWSAFLLSFQTQASSWAQNPSNEEEVSQNEEGFCNTLARTCEFPNPP